MASSFYVTSASLARVLPCFSLSAMYAPNMPAPIMTTSSTTAGVSRLQLLLVTLAGWVNRHQHEVIEFPDVNAYPKWLVRTMRDRGSIPT